ncbi:acyl-CoA thioesterase-1 [Marinospirillum celere]|uniref:Acyl-CoA thioesterase-1 n=1 Tax=Marinospirillum celere TaxID=1122252 RepID=A0A1I1HD29_9GAMM|nr:arylesterase [Marinospirillum celere]SFC19393.1 acyl-CoA thioesterase-1 [Marinospirillum celere]
MLVILKKSGLYSCLLALLLVFSLPAASDEKKTLLILGDSLSAAYNIPESSGWVSLLEERMHSQTPEWQVVNASISGETTSGGLTRLPDLLRQYQPEIVLLELAGNDGLRGLPPQRITSNLQQMIDLSQEAGAQVLLAGILLPPNYGRRYLDEFEKIFPSLAEGNQLPLIPFLLKGVADQPELMQEDAIHPTAEAQPVILETVWEELQPLLDAH